MEGSQNTNISENYFSRCVFQRGKEHRATPTLWALRATWVNLGTLIGYPKRSQAPLILEKMGVPDVGTVMKKQLEKLLKRKRTAKKYKEDPRVQKRRSHLRGARRQMSQIFKVLQTPEQKNLPGYKDHLKVESDV